MNLSLFRLISTAGAASLDELRARSPVDESVLTRDIVTMVGEGVVALSRNPEMSEVSQAELVDLDLDPEARDLLNRITKAEATSQSRLIGGEENMQNMKKLTRAIRAVLDNPQTADSVMISPTSWGFKIATS